MFYFEQKNAKMALKVNKCSILPKRGEIYRNGRYCSNKQCHTKGGSHYEQI